MAAPKQKMSRSRTRRRRARFYSPKKLNITQCPNCGEPKLPHRVCLNCGQYKGKQILEVGE